MTMGGEELAVEVLGVLRPHLAELASTAVNETLAQVDRQQIRVGVVESLRLDANPPECAVRIQSSSGQALLVHGYVMVSVPVIGSLVAVMFVQPSGALVWPIANVSPYRDIDVTIRVGATPVPWQGGSARARIIDSRTVHFHGEVLTTGSAVGPGTVFLGLPIPARFAPADVGPADPAGRMVIGATDTTANIDSLGEASSLSSALTLGGNVVLGWNLTYEADDSYDFG